MKYNELTLKPRKRSSQVGRGIAAGRGKTAGRGTKGQGARKSGGVRPGFEGGQTPIYMKIPKLRGFKSHHVKPVVIKLGQLEMVKKSVIDSSALAEVGLIDRPSVKVKVLVGGELKSKKEVRLSAASEAAIEAIKKAGGSFVATKSIQSTKSKKPELEA